MTVNVLAAATVGNPAANIGIFALFVAITLFIVIRASKKNTTAAEFFTAGRAFTGPQNGIAISGDYLSADRKSTRLNSSHSSISYAVFCLKKKKKKNIRLK